MTLPDFSGGITRLLHILSEHTTNRWKCHAMHADTRLINFWIFKKFKFSTYVLFNTNSTTTNLISYNTACPINKLARHIYSERHEFVSYALAFQVRLFEIKSLRSHYVSDVDKTHLLCTFSIGEHLTWHTIFIIACLWANCCPNIRDDAFCAKYTPTE